MTDPTVEALPVARSTLGESPLWDYRRGVLWWVDVRSPCIHGLEVATGAVRSFRTPEVVAAVALRRGGGLVACMVSGLWAVDPDTGAATRLAPRDDGHAGNRLNDTKVDAKGRLWTSTMWDFARERTGALYRVDADLVFRRMHGPVRVPNAISFAPDGRTLHFTDTAEGDILAFDLDMETGALGPPRVLAPADVAPGHPDGATVDAEGYLWNARFGVGQVIRLAPDGRLDRTVRLPATQVTACAFGGPDLSTLYVTTGTQGLTPDGLRTQVTAGALFAVDVGVRGRKEPEFHG
jgi:sugar lactone lactonase YvrE